VGAAPRPRGRRPRGTFLPAPVASYVIGQPVVVTVYPDGFVTFAVDLSDVGRARDIESDELTDEQIDAVAATVNTALHAGTYTIKES
jgi:hypothetical protein